MKSTSARILAPFSRITSGSRTFIPEIDGLRFFAIITVIFYHLNTHFLRLAEEEIQSQASTSLLASLIGRGGMGVQVFFAISGFILALPFARYHFGQGKRVALRSYFWRRLTRLEPPYILSLTVFFAAQIFLMHVPPSEATPHYLASLGYVHNIIYGAWSTINPVAWSLEVEVQFYVLAPLLSLVFTIRKAALRRGVIIGVMLVSVIITQQFFDLWQDLHLSKSLITSLHYFMVGFLVADVYLKHWDQARDQSLWWWDVAGLLGLVCLWYGKANLHTSNQLLFLIGTLALFVAAFRGRLFKKFFQNPWIATIGGMCYSIYLLHYGFLTIFMEYSTWLAVGDSYVVNYLIQALVCIPAVLLVSATYFVMAERPFMRRDWPQRLVQFLFNKPRTS